MANVKISTINTTGGYQQPVNANADGVVANGFYPQNATSNDANAGIERDASSNLTLKDANAGSKTLTQVYNGPAATVDVFTSSGTWTKPSGASMARVLLMGGGGGGQAGGTAAAGNARLGGSGGGAGQFLDVTISLAEVSSSVTVSVGAGSAGGTAQNGNGSTGGASSFGTSGNAYFLMALGGGGGGGVATSNGLSWLRSIAPLYTATYTTGIPSPSVMSGAVRGAGGAAGSAAFVGFSGGGGAGGGLTTANLASSGTACGASPLLGMTFYSRGQQSAASSPGGTSGENGGAGQTTQLGLGINAAVYFGSGGAGGGSSGTGNGGTGGAGAANSGAGGGGGGAGTSPGTWGNGGAGGSGWVVIISW